MTITQQQIEDMICEMLVNVADLPARKLNRDDPFDSYGLDSLSRVGITAEVARRIAITVDTEAALECETPRLLAQFFVDKLKSENSIAK